MKANFSFDVEISSALFLLWMRKKKEKGLGKKVERNWNCISQDSRSKEIKAKRMFLRDH